MSASSSPNSNRPRLRWHRVRQLFLYDPWRKLISLLLGLMCLVFIKFDSSGDGKQRWITIENVPVVLNNSASEGKLEYYFPEGAMSPSTVSLDIAIDFWQRNRPLSPDQFKLVITPQSLKYYPDSTKTTPLRQNYRLQMTDLREKPDGVSIRRFNPESVTVMWDKYVKRDCPIIIDASPGVDYEVTLSEPTVTIFGPEYKVNQVTAIHTERLYLQQENAGTPYDVMLPLQPPSISGVTLEQEAIKVTVSIIDQKETIRRKFNGLRLDYLVRHDSNLRLSTEKTPSMVSAIIYGPAGTVNALKSEDILALCDLTPFSMPGVQEVAIQLFRLPPQVQVQAILPSDRIQVTLLPADDKPDESEDKAP